MSIVLDGTTGITTPGLTNTGTETLVNLTTTGNTTLGDATTDTLTVGVTGIVKDASGNVGIGTASPSTYGKLVSLGTDNATLFAAVGATNMLRVQGYNSTYVGTVLEAVNLAQSANTPLFINGSTIKFGISGTTQTTIDSSGNVGIGTTTLTSGVRLYASNATSGAPATSGTTQSTGALRIRSGSNAICDFGVGANAGTTTWIQAADQTGLNTSYDISMQPNGGSLIVGAVAPVSVGAGTHILSLKGTGAATVWGVGPTSSFGSFYVKSATSTGVVLSTSATAWASDSDERKKTTITPFENAINKICSLRAGTGRYLTDEESMSRSFLIAQDVQSVLPEAVDIGEDVDQSLMLRYTDVIPLLVAAIQEQQALILSLTARITTLETP